MKKSIKKIIICGANGFTGRYLCKEFLKRNIPFTAIIRPGNNISWMKKNNIAYKFVDLNNTSELGKSIKGYEVLISVASIAFGNAPSILKACKNENIKRVIFTSTTAIFTKLNAKSKKIRKQAENQIKNSDLNWTIIRPTMIYGNPNDRNIIKLIKWIDYFPFIPVIGSGLFLQQPIYVKDVAYTLAEIINNKKTFRKSFNISGKEVITFNQMIKIIKLELKTNCLQIHLPHKIIIIILKIFESLNFKLAIKSEQIERLNENKDFNHSKAKKVFNFNPKSFKEGVRIEIDSYKKKLNKSRR